MVFGYHTGGDSVYHFRAGVASIRQISAGPTPTNSVQSVERHDSGGRDEGGITISRRPNKRPSREKAPGPSNARATAVIIIPKATSLASCMLQGDAGNHERAIPRKHSPTRSPANGVKNPAARAAPLDIKTKPSNHLAEDGLAEPER
jgi:hypothetical protein